MKKPHLLNEIELWEKGFLVAGIDEVGRGSFAGPLVTCSVVLKPIDPKDKKTIGKLLSLGINDSKLVTIKLREEITKTAQKYILFSNFQYINVSTINQKGIGFANKKGFSLTAHETLLHFSQKNIFFLTDAFSISKIKKSIQRNIISGDRTSITIALASILAKVERDRFMMSIAKDYKIYGFEKHKGYGTLSHRNLLKQHGPCPIHRTAFIQNHI